MVQGRARQATKSCAIYRLGILLPQLLVRQRAKRVAPQLKRGQQQFLVRTRRQRAKARAPDPQSDSASRAVTHELPALRPTHGRPRPSRIGNAPS